MVYLHTLLAVLRHTQATVTVLSPHSSSYLPCGFFRDGSVANSTDLKTGYAAIIASYAMLDSEML